ncbi:hypothetical protein LCGC14_1019080 [marine sediment metagenome]|uniref:Uncharacterized protein n=1 Tax=marine sediment metagenome TaxID=412755 RepID=A0A0F9MXY4_9ZZZZ
MLHCPDCLADKKVTCPRNPDAQCLECGKKLCAAHIASHLKEVHCMSLSLDYCSEDEGRPIKVEEDRAGTVCLICKEKILWGAGGTVGPYALCDDCQAAGYRLHRFLPRYIYVITPENLRIECGSVRRFLALGDKTFLGPRARTVQEWRAD